MFPRHISVYVASMRSARLGHYAFKWPLCFDKDKALLLKRARFLIPIALAIVFALLVIRQAGSTSATDDETAHLPAGCAYLRWDDFRLNPEHPPLIKEWAALFALRGDTWPREIAATGRELAPKPATDSLTEIKRAWASSLDVIESEWLFGHYFLYGPRPETMRRFGVANPLLIPTNVPLTKNDFLNDADALLFRGRMAVMLLGMLLAALIFLWARELWGFPGGALAMALFCFDPNFIAHSGLVTTDVGETAFMFGAVYFLWRTCRRLDFWNVLLTLLFFGLAFASKFTSILLVPMFFLLALVRIFSRQPWQLGSRGRSLATRSSKALAAAALLAAAMLSARTMIWASYGFRYSAASGPLHALPIENLVRQTAAINAAPAGLSGRLILAAQHTRVLPEAYLYGFAYARLKSLSRSSFLRGQYSDRGFWNYFLWSFALKTPLLTLAAIAAGLAFAIRRREPCSSRLAFLLVPVLVYWGVTLSSHLNIGHRHLLPVYPFLFIIAGGLALEWSRLRPPLQPLVALLSLAAIAIGGSVVFAPPWRPALVYPHYLAYFNEIAGGPRHGYESLVDSNLDWGQDLIGLKQWLGRHGTVAPLYLCYFGTADPRYYGIRYISVPRILGGGQLEPSPYVALESKGLEREAVEQFTRDLSRGGYIAISATSRAGIEAPPAVRDIWRQILDHAVPVDQVGYSIFIYRVDPAP